MKSIVRILLALALCLSCVIAMSACDETLYTGSTTENTTGSDTKDAEETETETNAPTEAETDAPEDTPEDVVIPDGTQNAVVIRYTENGNNTVTATVSVEGTVSFAGLTGDLNYDASVLTLVSSEPILGGMIVNGSNAGVVSFSYASISNLTSAQQLFKVTFSYSGTVSTNLSFSIDSGDFCNASFEDVSYSTFGEALTLG